MKNRQDNRSDVQDFYQRCVLAGLLVLTPNFVAVPRNGLKPESPEELPEYFGVEPTILPGTEADLGFTEQEWKTLKAASDIIFAKLMVDYDPPNCPDEQETRALMLAARALDTASSTLRQKRESQSE